jgi:hypothetical protein
VAFLRVHVLLTEALLVVEIVLRLAEAGHVAAHGAR